MLNVVPCGDNSTFLLLLPCHVVRLLNNNRGLNGTLPSVWGNLLSLKTVRLDEGNLTGQTHGPWLPLIL